MPPAVTPGAVVRFLSCVILCLSAGMAGAVTSRDAIRGWYATLAKPEFSPPAWIFGPVWTLLYVLMGTALFIVWGRGLKGRPVKVPVALFMVQLLLNAAWSPLFFGAHSPLLGLIDIVLLWVFVLLTIIAFFRVSSPAGYLLVPYILWVSFAAVLNASILSLN